MLAYFKVCVVLFSLMEKELNRTSNMNEFLIYIATFLESFTDIEKFKEKLRGCYLSKKLVSYIRSKITSQETTKYHQNMKQRFTTEKCMESSPYCFMTKNTLFTSDNNFVVRSENFMSNLRSNYYDVIKSNEQYATNFFKKYTDDSYYDSLYRRKQFYPYAYPPSLVPQFQNTFHPQTLESVNGLPSDRRKESESYKSSKGPQTNLLFSSLVSGLDSVERSLLIVRMDHICYLRELAYDKKRSLMRRKSIFFEKTVCLIERYFGPKLKEHLQMTIPVENIKKTSTNALVKNFELRSSLDSGRPPRGMIFKNQSQSEEKLHRNLIELQGYSARKTLISRKKSANFTLTGHFPKLDDEGSSSEDSEVDSIEKINEKVRENPDAVFRRFNTTNEL